MIDQTASELELHRILYVIKFLRAMILHVILAVVAVLLYFFTGITNAYPVATALIHALRAQEIDSRLQGGPITPAAFTVVAVSLVIAILVLLIWMYRSITDVRRSALRFQSVLLLIVGLSGVWTALPNIGFAFQHLSLLFAVLATLGVATTGVIMPAGVARALWRVARLRERSSLVATLDPRLAPNLWVYLNKLLDLPRTPLRTLGTMGAYAVALAGGLLMIASIFYLFTVGGAANKLATLAVISKHGMRQEAVAASFFEAREILLLLPCALAGVKLAALLQSTAKKLGGLSVSDVIKGSDDQFVLYLRPFDLDDVFLPKPRLSLGSRLFSFRPYPVRIEEELFDVADGYRPMIAVGEPGESKTPEGGVAYRAFLADSEWQAYVADRIRRADRIVMVIDDTEGVRWEFDRILKDGAVAKTLFFFHPEVRNPKAWEAVEAMIVPALKRAGAVPQDFAFHSRPIGFHFRGGGLVELVNVNWSATSYRTAFSHFLAEPLDLRP